MKKHILPLLLIISVLFTFSCKKNEGAQTLTRIGSSAENESNFASSRLKSGFVMPVTSGFYVLDGSDDGTEATKARWNAQLALGEVIFIGEPRRLTWINNNNVASILNFVEARRENGTEGFALANQVIEGGRLAVVTDERATLHRTARTVDVSGIILSRRTVVIYYPETENSGFVEVRGWDPVRERYIDPNNCFVRLNTLSRRESDIQSSILLQTALALPINAANNIRRELLLESAIDDYPDSVFFEEIHNIRYPQEFEDYPNTIEYVN